ncbi:hypothetical protein M409DRAFT_52232 [Zasmidium cellare ATCC 36951]|uniref:Succinate dehydrogenase assembly factor 3 n=1 Tax=Zasmidium cellare ATCC 36951 TaxID=1080233 RepID=A0A6A6CSP4_ZASCE|nr:uncharacterized protein M409DRAFT_52232 [Zasmidium cellare ATCC 36951]KAF2169723.1 hypothetical protein M409DRAFT_52232 [Zasmidium cellare ATCC 36951]
MRATSLLRATASSIGTQSSGLKPVPLALLPPIPLYRRLLRAHRKHLPKEMRLLGDEYVKSEFRAHRSTDNPVHIVGFLTEWQTYAQQIEGDTWRGEKMDKSKVDKMSDQQIGQMFELMNAIREKELQENDPEYRMYEPPKAEGKE